MVIISKIVNYIGIDPGKNGGISFITEVDGEIKSSYSEVYSDENIINLIRKLSNVTENNKCVLEHVHAMPGQGVTSMFNFGANFGFIQGVLKSFGVPDVIWLGTPCQSYSIAAISKHRRKNEETGNLDGISEFAKKCDRMNWHCRKLVEELMEINPKLIYFWENPRSAFRKMDFIQGIPRYTVWYCKYMEDVPPEQRRAKPTDLFTNHPNPKFKPECKNGANDHHAVAKRGMPTGTQGMKGAKEMSYPTAIKNYYNVNNVLTLDIREDSLAAVKGNYLEMELDYEPHVIITNPPFNKALEIVKKALNDVEDGGYVIMLLRLNFLETKARKEFFDSYMPEYIFVHHKRMSFVEGGGTDSVAYAHYVWRKGFYPEFSKIKVI